MRGDPQVRVFLDILKVSHSLPSCERKVSITQSNSEERTRGERWALIVNLLKEMKDFGLGHFDVVKLKIERSKTVMS